MGWLDWAVLQARPAYDYEAGRLVGCEVHLTVDPRDASTLAPISPWIAPDGTDLVRMPGRSLVPMIVARAAHPSDAIILLFRGRKVDASRYALNARRIAATTGIDVLAVEYPGYGPARPIDGEATLEGMLAFAKAAYLYAIRALGKCPRKVVLYGRSLGTISVMNVAASIPAELAPALVMLHSPMRGFRAVAMHLTPIGALLKERWDTVVAARQLSFRTALMIVHGGADSLAPPEQGMDLFVAAAEVAAAQAAAARERPAAREFILVPGCDHEHIDWRTEVLEPLVRWQIAHPVLSRLLPRQRSKVDGERAASEKRSAGRLWRR